MKKPAKPDNFPLASLKLNDRNPRTINKDAFAKLCKSVREFPKMMELRGIVVDADNIIIGGTQRYRACVANGMTEVPASWIKHADTLTPAERKRFVVADNAPDGLSGDWDMDILSADFDMAELLDIGFDEKELTGIIVPDENKSIDEKEMSDTKNECPKCGFKW